MNLVNEVCANVHYFFYMMALSKFAASSTLQGFPILPNVPNNHLSPSFKFLYCEFGKKQIVKHWSALVTQSVLMIF